MNSALGTLWSSYLNVIDGQLKCLNLINCVKCKGNSDDGKGKRMGVVFTNNILLVVRLSNLFLIAAPMLRERH